MPKPRPYRPLLELTRARMFEFWREPGAVFWVFVFPVLLAIGLGVAFRNQPPSKLQIAVDLALPDAHEVAKMLGKTKGLDVKLMSGDEAAEALRKGRVGLVVAPPPSGATSKAAERHFLFRFDGTRPDSRSISLVVNDALQRALGRVEVATIHEATQTETGARYIDFLIPGLIGLNLMGSGMWGIGYVVVQARNRKLLKRFAATPMRRSHYLLSFIFSRLVFLVLEVAALVTFGWAIFDVTVAGSILTLAIVSLIGAYGFMGVALLVAARPESVEAATGWMNFIMLPMWLLSGAFFSYERFPEIVQPAIKVLPLTALNDALRLVINDGASITATLPQCALLLLWGTLSFIIALKIFRWQ